MAYRHIAIIAVAILTIALLILVMISQRSVWGETLQQHGGALAASLCSHCHAIGRTGDSPLPAAPRFRSLDDRTDLDQLSRRMREGLLTGHDDMPMFRFRRYDADAVVAYIRSIQGP